MASRTNVFLRLLPDGKQMYARTDLTGRGGILEGIEFTVRELWPIGRCRLLEGGRKLRVRVVAIERHSRGYHILHVKILEDLTPPPPATLKVKELF